MFLAMGSWRSRNYFYEKKIQLRKSTKLRENQRKMTAVRQLGHFLPLTSPSFSHTSEEVRAAVSKSVDRKGERVHFFHNLLFEMEDRKEPYL